MVAFHHTFAPIKSFENNRPNGVIWNESIAGRKAVDLASVYVEFIRKIQTEKQTNEIMIWVDNCFSQNKNWWLLTALVAGVNRKNWPKLIGLKYFKPGHTFISEDAFHSVVEQIMKRKKQHLRHWWIFVSYQFTWCCIRNAILWFYSVPKVCLKRQLCKRQTLSRKYTRICLVQFRKGSQNMFWWESFKEEFQSAIFLQKKASHHITTGSDFPMVSAPRGILSSKKQDLVEKLRPLMGNNKNKAYWLNLPECETTIDLADTQEDGNYELTFRSFF